MKKRIIVLLLGLVVIFSFAACQGNNEKQTVIITYDLNYASAVPEARDVKIGDSIYTVAPTRPDDSDGSYVFNGWYSDSGTNAAQRIAEDAVISVDTTVYAGWTFTPVDTRAEYTLKFKLAGGTGTPPTDIIFRSGDSVTMPVENGFGRENYRLGGWRLSGSDTIYTPGEVVTPANSNADFNAVWVALRYIDFDLNGQQGEIATISGVTGESIDLPVPVTDSGYTFDGWNIDGKVYKNEKFVFGSSSVTAVACWAGKYNVSINYDVEGVENYNSEFNTGDECTMPAAPEKYNYVFEGYQLGSDILQPGDKVTIGYENLQFTAVWRTDVYTVGFYDWDGTCLQIVETLKTESFVKPKIFVEDFEEFVRWDNDFSDVKDGDRITAVYDRTFSDKSYFGYRESGSVYLLTYVVNDQGRLPISDLVLPPSIGGKPIYGTAGIGMNDFVGGGQPFYGNTLQTIYIPSSYVQIGSRNFRCTFALKSVTFGANSQMQVIGSGSFYSSAIASFVLPKTVQTIADSAFMSCESLAAVTFENDSELKTLGGGAFQNCSSLKAISLPQGLTVLGNGCFERSGLTSVTIPDSVTTINQSAFYQSSVLAKINISENSQLTALGRLAFANTAITDIYLPAGITELSDKVFQSNKSLEKITVAGALTSIGEEVFGDCYLLAYFNSENEGTFNMPATLRSIGLGAFMYNESMKVINFGDNSQLNSIGNYAFAGFYPDYSDKGSRSLGLTSIDIPASVTILGDYAFFYNVNLAEINIAEGNANYFSDMGVLYGKDGRLLCIPIATTLTEYTVSDNTTEIITDAAPMLKNLKKIIMPESLRKIGQSAFAESSIEEAVLNDGINEMGMMVFQGSKLRTVNFPRGMINIPQQTFTDCYYLESFTVPKEIETISNFAFYMRGTNNVDDARLGSIVFETGSTIKLIGANAFAGTGISTITIPASLEEFGNYVFNFSDLETIVFEQGSKLTALSYGLFHSSKLSNISLGGHIRTVGDYAFTSTLLTQIDLTGVKSIGGYAFYGTKLTSVEIPSTVIELGGISANSEHFGVHIFSNCEELTTVTLNEGLVSIGNYVFNGCSKLTDIIIPSTVNYIGNAAFSLCTSLNSITLKSNAVINSMGEPLGSNSTTKIYVRESLVAAYKQSEAWSKYSSQISPITED